MRTIFTEEQQKLFVLSLTKACLEYGDGAVYRYLHHDRLESCRAKCITKKNLKKCNF